jgi:hypothetical protein
MEGGPTGAQQGPRQTHLVKSLQEQDVQGATSVDEDSVELDILNDGANYERIPPRLWHKVRVVTAVEGDGDLRPFKVLGVVGETTMTYRAVSFCFLLNSYESGPQ